MSTPEQRLFERTRELLIGFGFGFYFGAPHVSELELRGKWWYAWCGPNGDWDVEVGLTCDSEEEAVANAIEQLADYFTRKLTDAGVLPLPEVTQ